MYFWNITKLKEEIRGGGPSENECFKYLLAFGIFFALCLPLPRAERTANLCPSFFQHSRWSGSWLQQ
jgi:hypothetical protein